MGERIGMENNWQFPQGGIDKEEIPIEAAKRELFEEVGIQDGEMVYEHEEWLSYDFPSYISGKKFKKFRGQTQKWFLVYWNRPVEDCILDGHEPEFSALQFIPLQNSLETVVEFKREVYEKLIEAFEPKIHSFLEMKKKL